MVSFLSVCKANLISGIWEQPGLQGHSWTSDAVTEDFKLMLAFGFGEPISYATSSPEGPVTSLLLATQSSSLHAVSTRTLPPSVSVQIPDEGDSNLTIRRLPQGTASSVRKDSVDRRQAKSCHGFASL